MADETGASWIDDVACGRFRAVRAAMPAWPTAAGRAALAELARFGEASRAEVVLHGATSFDPKALADAVRELTAIGAKKTVERVLEAKDAPTRAAVEEALAASRARALAKPWLHDDDVLRELSASPIEAERVIAARLFGGRAIAALDFESALSRLAAPEIASSRADLAIACATDAALVAFAAGDAARARSIARAVAEKERPRAEAIEDAIGAGEKPAWTRSKRATKVAEHFDGRGLIAALGLVANADKPLPQMAHADDALRRLGPRTLRARLDVAKIERALAAGATVVLEEERSMRTAFRIVLAAAADAKLLVVRDPDRREAWVVPAAWQAGRSWLFSGGALVILGEAEEGRALAESLALAGIVDDAALRALDRSWVDEDGATPTLEAAIARLRDVVKATPDLPVAHAWLGDALLDAATRDDAAKDELTAWYAGVRERFPLMEAPSQTYARYLERWGTPAEAGIAWAAAFHRDEHDARNALGWGRALKRMGRTDEAYVRFRDALRLDPDDPSIYGWLSTCHFAREDFAGAELWARVACDVQPQNRSARALLADALEAQGDAPSAEAPLREAWELGRLPEDGARVARATYRNGDVDGARTTAVDVARRAGGVEAWAEAIHLTVASGDSDGAWELAKNVARAPRSQGWHHAALDGAVTLAPDATIAADRGAQIVELAGRDVPALCDVAIELAWRGYAELSRIGLARLVAVAPDDANTPWALVRAALRGDTLAQHRAAVDEAIGRLVEQMAPGFVPVRAVACALALEASPQRVLDLATHQSFVDDPKSWLVQSVALRALGEPARAEALEKRLASLDGPTLALVSDFFRFYRFWDLVAATLRLSSAGAIDADKYLSLEQAALDGRGEQISSDAFERARAAWRKHDWIPGSWICRMAIAARRRDALAEDGLAVAASFARSSGRAGDTWVYRAFAASARSFEDGGAARAEIVSRLPEHPWLRTALAVAGAGLGASHAEEDARALERRCPVTAAALRARWGRP